MVHPLIPSLAVAVVGLIGARLSDALRHPIFHRHARKSTAHHVVWHYGQTAASSSPRKDAKRVVSNSPR